jgi:streptomycin 6-kinase
MVRLLAYDSGSEVMLLERLQPGTLLSAVEDDAQAISAAADVMRQVWRPVPHEHPFPSILDWGKGLQHLRRHYEGGCGPFPAPVLEEAESLLVELGASMRDTALLHGDLHQDNILAAERSPWLAIDPKGLIGEPACEIAALLHNPLPRLLQTPHPGRTLARRVDQLAEELGFDRVRVRGWGIVLTVLASWWSVEDSGHTWDDVLICAELLAAIKV